MSAAAARMRGLARRFLELAPPARQRMVQRLRAEQIDFALLPIVARPSPEPLVRASFAQQRLWFTWNLDKSSPAYNLTALMRLRGSLSSRALGEAFADLSERHESLRTTFQEVAGQAFQLIHPPGKLTLPCVDLQAMETTEQQGRIDALIHAAATGPMDLERGPLCRASLIRVNEREHLLLITLHHMICDGVSLQVALEELPQLYAARVGGQRASLAALPIQYADYALWQRLWLEAGELERQLTYWRGRLGDHHPILELPTDRPRPPQLQHAGASIEIKWDVALAQRLRAFAQARRVTPFMALLAAFKAILYRYSGETDLRVGAPVANRTRAETQGVIGFFVNTQVLRTEVSGDMTFDDLLQRVKATCLDAQANQDLPFDLLVEALGPERDLAYHPLFQVKFTLQVFREGPRQAEGVLFEPITTPTVHAHFDLSLDVIETGSEMRASFTYATALFERDTVERMGRHFDVLLRAVLSDPQVTLDEVSLESGRELAARYSELCGTQLPPAADVISQIDAVTRRAPHTPAVCCEDRLLSYGDLERVSRSIAQQLRSRGMGPEAPVVVCCERSPALVSAMLGVLRAGATWVPVDPQWPAARIQFVVQDCGARCMLVSGDDVARWREMDVEILPVAETVAGIVEGAALDAGDEPRIWAEQAAYMVYTSGSTGTPKGVVISRAAIADYVQGVLSQFSFAPDASMALVSTAAADLGFTVLFGALCSGRLLHVISARDSFDAERFAAYMRRHAVGILKIVPSHLAGLLQAARPDEILPEHAIVLGGEASPWSLLETIRHHKPRCRIINHYGPTETTVGALAQEIHGLRERGLTAPIGHPLPNTCAAVLDSRLRAAPAGLPGELYLGGPGVARGYLERAALTAERFVPDPHGTLPGARLYRTGDRVRILADGKIEFLGRLDQQIKLRGFRVEPEEVAHVLRELPGVAEGAVIARRARLGDAPERWHLLGYFVPAAGHALDPERLRAQLALRLPDHLIPTALMHVQALPVTANGKLDRAALPLPDLEQARTPYEAPADDIELRLARIWAEVLGVARVGVHDNFFKLGGDSILSLQVIARARKEGVCISLKLLFEHQTIRALAQRLSRDAGQATAPPISPADRSARLPLSFAQQRLWVLWKLEPEQTAYNIVATVRLTGPLQVAALRGSFDALVERHEILRTVFPEDALGPYQLIRPPQQAAASWRFENGSVLDDKGEVGARVRQLEREPFDLSRGPLLRIVLLSEGEAAHVLIVSMHHIVSDGWSMNVLVEEFSRAYQALSGGSDVPLSDLSIQYADYAVWQRQWLEVGEKERQLAFWREHLGSEHSVLKLPADRPRPVCHSGQGGCLQWPVEKALCERLRGYAQSRQASLFMVLLTTFQVLLYRYSGQRRLRVGVPVANRDRPETQGLIGFFINTLVLQSDLEGQWTLDEVLQRVQAQVVRAQAYQDLPFEQLVEALNPPRSLAYNPLFQVMYSHQRRDWLSAGATQVEKLRIEPLPHDSRTTQFDLTLDTLESGSGFSAAFTYSTDLFDLATIEQLARHWRQLLQIVVERPDTPLDLLPIGIERHGAPADSTEPPAFTTAAATPPVVFLPPSTARERELAHVWREVLGIKELGRYDNFFHLGGDSISAIQVAGRARSRGLALAPRDLFLHQTLAELASVARRLESTVQEELPAGPIELTPIQHWFFEQAVPCRHHWNQSVLLEASERLDENRVERVMQRLVEHHDALRLRFLPSDGRYQQTLDCSAPPSLTSSVPAMRGPEFSLHDALTQAQRSLDLVSGPLFRALIVHLSPETSRLLLIAHHLVVDGVSWRILLEDFCTLYSLAGAGEALELPPRTTSFARWSHLLERFALSDSLQREAPFWQAMVDEAAQPLLWAHPHGANTAESLRSVESTLDERETAQLLRRAPQACRAQVADLLLTALACALCDWTGQDSVCLELEGHGRENLIEGADLTRTVGWFTSVYPVRLTPGRAGPDGAIRAVKEQLNRVPNKGFGYGVLRYLCPRIGSSLARGQPQARFNYLGQLEQSTLRRAGFRILDEDRGEERDPQSLRSTAVDIIGMVVDEKLRIVINYSLNLHSPSHIAELLQRYVECLRAIIAHCLCAGVSAMTPADFPLASLTQEQLNDLPWAAKEIDDILPLSPLQQGMLFHSLAEPADGFYVNQQTAEVGIPLDLALFQRAWCQVFDANETVRTAFWWKGLDHPVQVLKRYVDLPFTMHDWTDRPREQQERDLRAWLEADLRAGFDLSRPPLMRVNVIRLDEHRTRLVWTDHHLLFDGWSSTQILADVLRCYVSLRAGELPPRVAPPSFRAYIAWLRAQPPAKGESFWRAALRGFGSPSLTSDYHVPKVWRAGYGVLERQVSDELGRALRCLRQQHGLTFSSVMQGAVALWLSVQTQKSDVLFGVTVSGRNCPVPGIERMAGMFINTLPLRVRCESEASVAEWLQALQAHGLEMRELEHAALVDLQAYTAIPRGTALFDTLLVVTNYPVDRELESLRVALKLTNEASHDRNNYPLSIAVAAADPVRFKVGFDTRHFDADLMEGLFDELLEALRLICAHPAASLGQVMAPLQRRRMRQLQCVPAYSTGPWPASLAQEALWAANQFQTHAPLIIALSLQGVLDEHRLGAALSALLERHASLRRRFFFRERQLCQDIDPTDAPMLEAEDLSMELEAEQDARIRLRIEREQSTSLKVNRASLRAVWLRRSPQRHVLILAVNALACDYESALVLARDAVALLRSAGPSWSADPPVSMHANHALWQRRQLAASRLNRQGRTLPLSAEPATEASPSGARKALTIDLGGGFAAAMATFAALHDISALALLAAATALSLEVEDRKRWTLEVEIAETVPRALSGAVGLFRSFQPLVTSPATDEDCAIWLRRLAGDLAKASAQPPDNEPRLGVLRVTVEAYSQEIEPCGGLHLEALEVHRDVAGSDSLIRLVLGARTALLLAQHPDAVESREFVEGLGRCAVALMREILDGVNSVTRLRKLARELRIDWLARAAQHRGERMRVSRSPKRRGVIEAESEKGARREGSQST